MSLDRSAVVRTALRLLNEVGLDGLSLRRLAKELDIKAPAIYWHFTSKQDLLDEMATTILADLIATAVPRPPWERLLADTCHGLRRALLSYRDGAKMFSGTTLQNYAAAPSMERSLQILTDAGFPLHDAIRGWSTAYAYTIGFTIEEQAATGPAYDPEVRAERIGADRHPLAAAAGSELFGDHDKGFEDGLQLILSGMATRIPPLDE